MGVHLAAGVNPCILLAWGNVLPKLSLFSLSLHNSKWVTAALLTGYHRAKIPDIPLRGFSHNALEMSANPCELTFLHRKFAEPPRSCLLRPIRVC
ncbi:hypothetical protein CRG98_001061 [Punica granatum]|uniref:Uncharacterized protein n=1 Tax=Punica granatum TaxID=22663 RepID=A0A2I0LD04_PUNGR|nr:hypothetical protein CRG98_001061 [Punica granatum]